MVFQVATVHIQPIEAARLNLSVAGQMTMKTAKHVAGEHGKEILKYKKRSIADSRNRSFFIILIL